MIASIMRLPPTGRLRLAMRPAYSMLPGLLLLLVVIFSAATPTFHSPGNVIDILRSASISMIMFLGVTWIMATGLTDLSFMEVAAFSGMLLAFLVDRHVSAPAATVLAIGAGVVFGAVNGLLVSVLEFPALITTVAVAGFCRSSALILGAGQPIYLHSTGFLGEIWKLTVLGLPLVIPFTILLYAGAWFVQEKLLLGHYVFAMEQNRKALVEAGISCRLIGFVLFVLTGVLAAIAGLALTTSLNSGQPTIGNSFFLDGLTAVLLGAMTVRPGQPNVIGTLFGVIILTVLVNGLSLLGWPSFALEMIKGALLLAGVSVAIFEKRAGRLHER